ncbi:hypothetical protein [Mycoplasma sp. P36-A1]|uniref:hypothetical protein n=1 Tax=Mycoplasma sp. P36-A1 TaxID=3252900 RepID=UPI003C2DA302
MNRVYEKFASFINITFLFVSILMLYFSLRSPIFDIQNLTPLVFFITIISLIIFGVLIINKKSRLFLINHFNKLKNAFVKDIGKNSIKLFIIAVVLQIIIIINISTPIGWDVGAIFKGVKDTLVGETISISGYLSRYPNNSLYFFIMLNVTKLGNFIHSGIGNTWMFWQLFNIFIIDVGVVLFFFGISKIFNKSFSYISTYALAITVMLSPHILVPYTDTFSLSITCIIIFVFGCIGSVEKINNKILLVILLSALSVFSYLLKPTGIIFVIAFILVFFLNIKKSSKQKICLVFIFLALLFSFTKIANNQIYNQDIIDYDSEKKIPLTHWVMMGLKGNGGYNREDVNMTASFKSYDQKKEYTIDQINLRLKEKGFLGYIKFLFNKLNYNVSRGDFSWGLGGEANLKSNLKSNNVVQAFLRDTYYSDGDNVKNSRFYMQFLWIIGILGMILSTLKVGCIDNKLVVCKTAFLGGLLFLLIFEGGRSRYLIQFIPIYILISVMGYYRISNIKKNLM